MMAVLPSQSPQSLVKRFDDDDQSFSSSGAAFKAVGGVEALLAQPIEFVPGTTLTNAMGKIPYEPCNEPFVNGKKDHKGKGKEREFTPALTNSTTSSTSSLHAPSTPTPQRGDEAVAGRDLEMKAKYKLWDRPIALGWPSGLSGTGAGFVNLGNTCYLNSVLQALLHTPPLTNLLLTAQPHKDGCPVRGFCMICALTAVMEQSFKRGRSSFAPKNIAAHVKDVSRTLRIFRQEDAHEFLRCGVEVMQQNCLVGTKPKLPEAIKQTTWVHGIFGGKLRSRVTCLKCKHPSDTFDPCLDLSLDIKRCTSVVDALKQFVAIDKLVGSEKYKCQKCKMPVNATKQFTIHEAPRVLTIQLKRFGIMGNKINQHISYSDNLNIHPFMSAGQPGAIYRLVGVVSHSGSGPHSGHYYAHVLSPSGRWTRMDDSSVTTLPSVGHALNLKSAYLLFYVRDKGDALERAIHSTGKASGGLEVESSRKERKRKRKAIEQRDSDEEESGSDDDTAGDGRTDDDESPLVRPSKRPALLSASSPVRPTSTTAAESLAAAAFYGSSPLRPHAQVVKQMRKMKKGGGGGTSPFLHGSGISPGGRGFSEDEEEDLGERAERRFLLSGGENGKSSHGRGHGGASGGTGKKPPPSVRSWNDNVPSGAFKKKRGLRHGMQKRKFKP